MVDITIFSTSYWRWNTVEFWMACFQRPTYVEILTSFWRHVFNILLTLKFWRVLTSIFQRPTDVDFWLFNVVNQIQRIFNVGTTSYACWVETESKNSLSLLNYLGNLECSVEFLLINNIFHSWMLLASFQVPCGIASSSNLLLYICMFRM